MGRKGRDAVGNETGFGRLQSRTGGTGKGEKQTIPHTWGRPIPITFGFESQRLQISGVPTTSGS